MPPLNGIGSGIRADLTHIDTVHLDPVTHFRQSRPCAAAELVNK